MKKKLKIHYLRLREIAPNPNQRKMNSETVAALAISIDNEGLQSPISVKRLRTGKYRYQLSAGAHRLAACESLDWEFIPAFILDDGKAEIWSVSENILRAEPSALRRAEDWVARARHMLPKADLKGGKQPHAKGIKKLARELGVSPKTVSLSFRHAGLEPSVKELLYKHDLDKKGTFLTELTKLESLKLRIQRIEERRSELNAKQKKTASKRASSSKSGSVQHGDDDDGVVTSAKRPKAALKETWTFAFHRMKKSWKDSDVAGHYRRADRNTRVAFLRGVFDSKDIAKAANLNAGR